MADYQIFDPYFSPAPSKDEHPLTISEYSNLLFHQVQLASYIDDFPKLQTIYDLLIIVKVIDQLQLFSKAETKHTQEILRKLISQCREMPVSYIIEQLKELIESAKSNTRSELIVLLFSRVAPKSYSSKSLESFRNKIQPMLNVLPQLPEFEVANLRKRLDRISSVFKEHSPEADQEITSIMKKYHSA